MKRHRFLLTLTVLIITTLACSIFVGGPDFPNETIPVSTGAADNLKAQIESALLAGADTGIITLHITEEQFTSFIAVNMEKEENPAFQDAQVYLRNGHMNIYGKVVRGILNANILISLTITIDQQGDPKIVITNADFGPFPAPEGLKNSMTALITEAFVGSLGPIATGFRLESITIADGMMTVIGLIK